MLGDQNKLVGEIFAHEDKDKDHLISYDEFSGPKHDNIGTVIHVKRATHVELRH